VVHAGSPGHGGRRAGRNYGEIYVVDDDVRTARRVAHRVDEGYDPPLLAGDRVVVPVRTGADGEIGAFDVLTPSEG
jgi:hypothetical protein